MRKWNSVGVWWKHTLTGMLLLTGFTLRYWGMLYMPRNRMELFWGPVDLWAWTCAVYGAGALLGTCVFLWRRYETGGKFDSLLAALFWGWLVLIAAQAIPGEIQVRMREGSSLLKVVCHLLVWAVAVAATGVGFWTARGRSWGRAGWYWLRRIFWPLLLVLPVGLCGQMRWDGQGPMLQMERVVGNAKAPVVVIIFDMVGYEDVFDETGTMRADLPNWARLAERATVFHQARSGGRHTLFALPNLIVQDRYVKMDVRKDVAVWIDAAGRETSLDACTNSLPARAKRGGGRSQIVGNYLPWSDLMPRVWDGCLTFSTQTVWKDAWDDDVWHSWGWAAWANVLNYFRHVSLTPLGVLVKFSGVHYWGLRDIARDITAKGETLLRESLSDGDFVLLHSTLPHMPYLFDENGHFLKTRKFGTFSDPGAYRLQLRYSDVILGQWLDALEANEAGKRAWVFVMSDHARHDTLHTPEAKEHVPCLVRRPGQTTREDSQEPLDLTRLTETFPDFPF